MECLKQRQIEVNSFLIFNFSFFMICNSKPQKLEEIPTNQNFSIQMLKFKIQLYFLMNSNSRSFDLREEAP